MRATGSKFFDVESNNSVAGDLSRGIYLHKFNIVPYVYIHAGTNQDEYYYIMKNHIVNNH